MTWHVSKPELAKLVDPAGCSYAPLAQRLSHASGLQPDGLNKCSCY